MMITLIHQRKIDAVCTRNHISPAQRIQVCKDLMRHAWPQTAEEADRLLKVLRGMHPISSSKEKALAALYKDFGWNDAQQRGFNERTCGKAIPETQSEANKIYHGLEEIMKRLLRPHQKAVAELVAVLMTERYRMGKEWERSFVADIDRKLSTGEPISPQMVKKCREIAHKIDVDCGFPRLKDLANEYNRQHEEKRSKKAANQ